MNQTSTRASATALLAAESEWSGRALESVLVAQGYSVHRTTDGREALRLARRMRPDAVIVDQFTAEVSGLEVCRQLREDPIFDPTTPVVLLAGGPVSRLERAAAYGAGAWTLCTQPLDTDLLVRELSTFVRAKRAAGLAREEGTAEDTGLLSPAALERWAEKLAAVAVRKHEPLACVVLMAVANAAASEAADPARAAAHFIEASRAFMRQSDIVGRTVDGRIAMLAPDTDSAGVRGFVQRLRSAIEGAERSLDDGLSTEFRAGFFALDDFAATVAPAELIRRATRAVDHAQQATGDEWTFNFSQLPPS